MITFSQFRRTLHEKFYKGADTIYGYAEIFKNPTPDEMSAVGNGKRNLQLGAWLVKNDLFVWDRDHAEHAHVRKMIPGITKASRPMYLYWNGDTKTVRIELSSFTMAELMGARDYDDDAILADAASKTVFKRFTVKH